MYFSMMVPAAVILLVALLIFIIAGIRMEVKEGGKQVIKNVYVYLVLFATLMMVIGGSIGAFMALADIVVPTPYYQPYEEYRMMLQPREVEYSEEEIREKYQAMIAVQKESQIARAQNSLIKSLGWIVIPLPVFIYFHRRLEKN